MYIFRQNNSYFGEGGNIMEVVVNDVVGTKEAAAILGVSPSTVQRYCRQGRFGPDAIQDAPDRPWHIRRKAVLNMKKQGKQRGNQ